MRMKPPPLGILGMRLRSTMRGLHGFIPTLGHAPGQSEEGDHRADADADPHDGEQRAGGASAQVFESELEECHRRKKSVSMGHLFVGNDLSITHGHDAICMRATSMSWVTRIIVSFARDAHS